MGLWAIGEIFENTFLHEKWFIFIKVFY
jgi:hypothetical protein